MWNHAIPVLEADWRRILVTDAKGRTLAIAVRLQNGRIQVTLDDPGKFYSFAPQVQGADRRWSAVEKVARDG